MIAASYNCWRAHRRIELLFRVIGMPAASAYALLRAQRTANISITDRVPAEVFYILVHGSTDFMTHPDEARELMRTGRAAGQQTPGACAVAGRAAGGS